VNRLLAVLMLPLLGLDCLGNLAVGGSWRNTLSGEAWNHREHRWWGWTHRAIDRCARRFFRQEDHCQDAARREARFGSVWRAWRNDWR
jgi:hypothetical protein